MAGTPGSVKGTGKEGRFDVSPKNKVISWFLWDHFNWPLLCAQDTISPK